MYRILPAFFMLIIFVHATKIEFKVIKADDMEESQAKPLLFLMPSNSLVNLMRNILHQKEDESEVTRNLPVCSNAALNSHYQMKRTIFHMVTGLERGLWRASASPSENYDYIKFENNMCIGSDSTVENIDMQQLHRDISPDMPIEMRALCGFRDEDNVNEKRLPKRIRESKCLCNTRNSKLIRDHFPDFRCEPLYYDVPVLLLDETCTNYTPSIEKISIACIPVFTSESSTSSLRMALNPRETQVVEI
ncbi:interleukin-17 domain-containing protein [Ditylenchus destructor]|uniref:Interleukin-17 domain-containing protein n=1 Tax=Ditylenchus destructor TaxID=166010 RepID=A0AAD4MJ52_9BILA|nr:interleukin-17 domain-containing protein [Ditylenchus destructor]